MINKTLSAMDLTLQAGCAVGALLWAAVSPIQAFASEGAAPADLSALPADASDQTDSPSRQEPDIVVTGTLVRGIAPPGTNVIGVGAKAVQETGAVSTAQLLQTIPQLGSFNNLQSPAGGFSTVTTNRPNLRNLPGFTTSGSSPTLVLVDGHRVVGAGISVTSPDADIVPPGAIERIEIVPDGGSAVYGSDAVAGVINFITKKSYNGFDVGGTYGFADDYYQFTVNAMAGKEWGTGSAYIAYNYQENDAIFGRDRDWVFFPNTTISGVVAPSLRCSPGNVAVGSVIPGSSTTVFPLNPNGTLGTGPINTCDESDATAIYPSQHRHSALAGFRQELSDHLSFDVRAFYTNRKIVGSNGQFYNSTNFGPSFLAPFGFLQSPRVTGFATNTVYYRLPVELRQVNDLETYGIAPSFTAKLGSNWQLRLLTSYGESEANFSGLTADTTALNRAISAGLIDPYNLSASNPIALAAVQNFESRFKTRQRQFDARAVIDGDLISLPGGSAKIAVGVEYLSSAFIRRAVNNGNNNVVGTFSTGYSGLVVNGTTLIDPYGPATDVKLTRSSKSAFGELVVPIFGADNATTLLQELTVSAAGRYDDYTDFGNTFNPKFGVTWKPVNSLKIRGAWGKSFVAPSLADNETTTNTSANFVNLAFLLPPTALIGKTVNGVTVPDPTGRGELVVLGSKPGIQSQTAKTWSIGADFDPSFIPGLRLSATYWNIDYKGVISIPSFTSPDFYSNFIGTPAVTFNPTQAQLDTILGQTNAVSGTSCGGNVPGQTPQGCYVIIDARKQNLARVKLSGIDFAVNYIRPTGFGSIDLVVNGSYELKRDQQATTASAFINQLAANNSRFRGRATLGAQIDNLRAQVTLNHSQGYDLNPAVGIAANGTTGIQSHVSSYDVVDLFFKYDVKGSGAFKDVSLTLGINNVFDQDPPVFLQQAIVPQVNGYANGATLGRLIQFGLNKRL